MTVVAEISLFLADILRTFLIINVRFFASLSKLQLSRPRQVQVDALVIPRATRCMILIG